VSTLQLSLSRLLALHLFLQAEIDTVVGFLCLQFQEYLESGETEGLCRVQGQGPKVQTVDKVGMPSKADYSPHNTFFTHVA